MAATVTNVWGKPGAWALDSEEHEDKLNQEKTATPTTGNDQSADFPDLTTAAATKTKKKKGKPLPLGEFVTGWTNKPKAQTYQAAKGLTTEDMMMLPTGPRERTAEELDRSRLGGGFRSYGDRNNDSSNSRWGSNRSTGGGEEGRTSSREYSRADKTDDWGAQKKSAVGGGGGFDRKERAGGFFEGSNSRADESDRWVSNKSYTPPEGRRNVRFESSGGANSSDNWGKKKEEEARRFGGGGGGAFDSLREKGSGNELPDSDNWGRKREEAIGGSRPKLNLQPRKLPVVGDTAELKPNKGSNLNPFGDARPREQVLKEKGQDWREIDEKLDSMKMKEVDSKRGFRTAAAIEDQSEKSWRKNVSPSSSENNEIGNAEEPEGEEAQV
ncbi:eukaryotic translation initiation factor 4B3-like [Cynara cardunculus var. scolymus]|uniref:eukaryotic translation initiation factor 4B3-like n=1 Tax=Cynara cardunculus var. scolymus TaxID=59895 RepID=UPI000D623028|nr:eukaryotic translation initiation factor 4B3-like [Cynara cardunculus var. scolymus]